MPEPISTESMSTEPISMEEKFAVFRKCHYFLNGHPRKSPAEVLSELSRELSPEVRGDAYGSGKLIEDFEKKIARVLGFPAAVFMPSGTMAQVIALRIWSDRKGIGSVAFHPRSHLELHEHKAYSALHGLEGVLLGGADRPLKFEDLKSCAVPLAAVLLELPQREIGGTLPTWEELSAISAWAREAKVALHMDGARLWESQPFYEKSYAEIAGLFDSVYVSFYKGIGGIAGAILAGDERFIAEAKIWQRRQGGNLISLFPYVISAERNFDARVGRMTKYHQKAIEIAEVLGSFPEVAITPNPPCTNMMHAYFRAPIDRLNTASLEVARDHGVCLFYHFQPTSVPDTQMIEIFTGDSSLELSREKLLEYFQIFFEKLRA